MRKPLTPRQERFCQAFVLYGSATTAAREAGYRPRSCRNQGYRLMRTDRVRERIRAIEAELADHRDREREIMVGKLEVVYRRALEDHHFHAAARAVELQGRFAGLTSAPAGGLAADRKRRQKQPNASAPLQTSSSETQENRRLRPVG